MYVGTMQHTYGLFPHAQKRATIAVFNCSKRSSEGFHTYKVEYKALAPQISEQIILHNVLPFGLLQVQKMTQKSKNFVSFFAPEEAQRAKRAVLSVHRFEGLGLYTLLYK